MIIQLIEEIQTLYRFLSLGLLFYIVFGKIGIYIVFSTKFGFFVLHYAWYCFFLK